MDIPGKTMAWMLAFMALAGALRAPFLSSTHIEGDEEDVKALVTSLGQGRYTLRDAGLQVEGFRKESYVQAAVYHNPPLHPALGLLVRAVRPDANLYWLSYLSSVLAVGIAFLIGCRLRGWRTGVLSAAFVLLCPITQLISGKVWAEPLLALLILLLILAVFSLPPDLPALSVGTGVSVFLLSVAIVQTRHLGVFAAIFPLSAVLLPLGPAARKHLLACSAAGFAAGLAGWFLFVLQVTGSVVTPAVVTSSQEIINPFVLYLMNRNPFSFFFLPLLLMPVYGLAFMSGWDGASALKERVLAAFVLVYACGLSLLAWMSIATYHMKYMGPAMPALAICAACGADRWLERRPWLCGVFLLCALIYSARLVEFITFSFPFLALVEPCMVYSALCF